ncbi:MAG: hypothetical protein DI630_27765 [Gordonia sp. (in: high G+C Gram-positive bacteria)]|nr:MAG: hypothetical protein DI630_27765 [Gordonia sp. (in: high G+C Gram-positive bacteria)]
MSFFGQGGSNREPSFLRTFVPILLFTLLCGIVGPIFLVAYFLIDDPLTGWMFYAGLGITVADVVIGYFVAQSLYRRRRKRYNLEQNGRFGIGEVRSVDQTNVRINGQPMMKISLAISGDGIAPFDATKRVVVPFMFLPALRSHRVAVLVDTYSGEFDIDWQRTALLAGTSPARFTDTETGEEFDLSGKSDALIEIMRVFAENNIPFGGRVDLRSNPVVRDQVMDIARRHGRPDGFARQGPPGGPTSGRPDMSKPAEPSFTHPPAAAPGPPRTPGQRLAELESMRAAGTISLDEYRAVRTRILNDF